MGALQPLLWAKQSGNARPGIATCERLVNGYLQPNPPGSVTPFRVLGSPGLKLWGTFGAGPIRGWRYVSQVDRLFVVSDTNLYQVANDASSVLIGGAGAIPGSGPVSMCNNATQIWVATDIGLYCVDIAAATVTLVVTDPPNAYFPTVSYQDGYGIGNVYQTEKWFISGLDDLSTVDALDYSVADTFPDNAQGLISDHRVVTVFGADSIESYANTGAALFPFERMGGSFLEIGCRSGASIAKASDRLFWHADDGGIWSLQGNQPSKISTPEIDQWIRDRLIPSEPRAFVFGKDGAKFYGLSWSNGTMVYNLNTGLWHELESWEENRWRADVTTRAFDLDLAGDFENGNIYEIDPDTYGDEVTAGALDPLILSMQPPPIHAGGNRMAMSEIVLDAEAGIGLGGAGTGSNPEWMLDWSDDGGKTWSTQITRSAGLSGDYKHRVSWSRLGSFYRRTFRMAISDPVKREVLGAYGRWDVLDG